MRPKIWTSYILYFCKYTWPWLVKGMLSFYQWKYWYIDLCPMLLIGRYVCKLFKRAQQSTCNRSKYIASAGVWIRIPLHAIPYISDSTTNLAFSQGKTDWMHNMIRVGEYTLGWLPNTILYQQNDITFNQCNLSVYINISGKTSLAPMTEK